MPILGPKDIPKQLWSKDALRVPPCLCEQYETLLHKYNLMEKALETKDPGNVHGGKTETETLDHFARRYGVSTCRVESIAIDPRGAFGTVSDDILCSFSDGRLSLLDIACGTGAAGAALLCSVAVLRAEGKLPKLPLDVLITGADYSKSALRIYEEMFEQLRPALESVGIRATVIPRDWDAEKSYMTSNILDSWFKDSAGVAEFFVVGANFSGAAGPAFHRFEASFQHICDRLSNKQCTMIWIEPSGMPSAHKLFKGFRQLLKKAAPWHEDKQESPLEHEYAWFHPLQKRCLPCRVLVQKYHRS